jgi:hypothetical protein
MGLLLASCGDSPSGGDAGTGAREVATTTTVDSSGRSELVSFTVPDSTRSISIVVEGELGGLYALAELTFADGSDLVQLPSGSPSPMMQASYRDEQVGVMPGDLYQSIRLGTFSHVHPNRPDLAVTPGPASLRVASDTAGPVAITILMPEDDGGRTLHLNVITVSDTITLGNPPTFAPELANLFAAADLAVQIDDVVTLAGTTLETITDWSEPQEAPTSMSAMLPSLVAGRLTNQAVDVFVVEELPLGIGGLSLGTPGPPLRGSYYYGVVVISTGNNATMAHLVAHEVSHFLGLQHVTNTGISGTLYPDPLDDTDPSLPNLMSGGNSNALTADQAFVLGRSALLQ